MRRPKAIELAALLVALSLLLGSKRWLLDVEAKHLDHAGFFYDLLWRLNEDREMLGWSPFVQDVRLQEWSRLQIQKAQHGSLVSTDQILQNLTKEVPSVATASIFVAQAGSQKELRERIAEWALDISQEQIYLAANVFPSFDGEGFGSLVMSVRRLPRFHPKFLNKNNAQSFYNICPICKESHHGKVLSGARSIVLECPRCSGKYDLLALDLRGEYHRVNDFLVGQEPSTAPNAESNDSQSRLREMFLIWEELLGYCRYAKDFQRISGQRDAWQFSNETDRYRSGDCEDTAILLADWMISRGFEARVALGRTRLFEGHAWCVVRHEGEQYILETTEAKPDFANPPTIARLGKQYMPEFLFDREGIFFRKGEDWDGDYWSSASWSGVSYVNENEDLIMAGLHSE